MPEPEPGALAHQVEQWLAAEQTGGADTPLFWAPLGQPEEEDWRPVRSVEQLAVLVSTAVRRDNNICFASGAPHRAGRSANFIGLFGRESMVWAINVYDRDDDFFADVRRAGYPYDNYDEFSALTAAQIAVRWIRHGSVGERLELRVGRDGRR